jgi:hypothetical protein
MFMMNLNRSRNLHLAAGVFGGLLGVANPAFAQDWMQTSAPITNWSSVASSADGTKLVAAGYGIYTSTNSGVVWTKTSAPDQYFAAVAASADGSKIVAAARGALSTGLIYTSVDSGATWSPSGAPNDYWTSVACSADGTKLVAASGGLGELGVVYTSTNAGTTWVAVLPLVYQWTSVASSADGTKLVAANLESIASADGGIYTSTNSGATWTLTGGLRGWTSVASSPDGTKMVAATFAFQIYTSTNSGTTWIATSAPGTSSAITASVATSADGSKLVAAGFGYDTNGSKIYTSIDSGATWTSNSAPSQRWEAVASSADGTRLVAVSGGGIYTWAATLPVIRGQPASQTVLAGNNVAYGVSVIGALPLAYQWQLNGTNLLNATDATLTLTNVEVSDSGLCRVLVTNQLGRVLSSNALLTVLPALVTTQPANGISASAAWLNGLATPGASDTAVWFQWGADTNYGQTTPATNLGASSSQSTFNSPITGLAPTTVYHYQAVASNDLGIVAGADASFLKAVTPFTETIEPLTNWTSIASSADGTKLVAAGGGGNGFSGSIYASADSGATWTPTGAPYAGWTSVASSADGMKLVGVASHLRIYTSTNSGATWIQAPSLGRNWTGVASSADGRKLVAVDYGPIYLSTNSGASWTQTGAPNTLWSCVASSADGSKLVAGASYDVNSNPGQIYVSADSGATWSAGGTPSGVWTSVASSADGSKLIAAAYYNSALYLSTNSGATWTARNIVPGIVWRSVASSADGGHLVAAADQGQFYISVDSGATWGPSAPADYWQCVASSADGAKLAAVAYGSGIYTMRTTPRPLLNIAPSSGNAVIAWTIPSMDFVLQQNSDLTATNWTDVATPPVLNLTNLQNQVMASPTNGNSFYRLKH